MRIIGEKINGTRQRVAQAIEERNAARKAKDFTRADEIREKLTALGIELEDTRDGTRWKLRDD